MIGLLQKILLQHTCTYDIHAWFLQHDAKGRSSCVKYHH